MISKVGSGFAYGGGTATDPAKKKSAYQPFEEPTSKMRVDHKPDHKTKLDGVVAKMKADATLKAQLGGACDLTGDAKLDYGPRGIWLGTVSREPAAVS